VVIGLFIFAAIIGNKELTRKEENKEKLSFLTLVVLLLILGGLGFIFPASTSNNPNHAFLMFFVGGSAAVSLSSKGIPKVISRIAWVARLSYVILGSFY